MQLRYYSDELREKLLKIGTASLTMVEAPAGYGKTTAVRLAMETVPEDEVFWYTATESMADGSMDWFIHQIYLADRDAGTALRALGLVNRSNAGKAAGIISEMRVEKTRYLIVDNFQLVLGSWPLPVLLALADRRGDGLHVVLISQNFGYMRSMLEDTRSICRISSRDLMLDSGDITLYAEQLGLRLPEEEVRSIYSRTEGWAAAVSLCLENMTEGRTGDPGARDIDSLIFEASWRKTPDRGRRVLMFLAAFDRQNDEYLKVMFGDDFDMLQDFLLRVPLLRYDPRTGEYFPHEILLRFLRKQLGASEPEFRRGVYRMAGRWYRDHGNTKMAVESFYTAGDHEELLSCELTGLLCESFGGITYTQLAGNVLRDCGDELLARHPVSMLRLCTALFGGGAFDDFERAMERARGVIETLNDRHMLGEWYLASAFSAFPDVKGMTERYLEAERLMSGPSRVTDRRDPFWFGTTSMWYLFYRTPGKMLETGEQLGRMMEVYDRITGGHGAGMYEIYIGECLSVQGRFDESDIYAHKAAMLAERYENVSADAGAALLLGINAIYRSDMIALQRAIEHLESRSLAYPFLQGTAIKQLMDETARGYLLGLMMEPSRTAKWAQGDADALGDLTFANFIIKTNRVTDLVLRKKYKKAIASVEASLDLDSRLVSLSTRNFMYVGLALCYLAIGRPVTAAEWLERALAISEQDHNYTFIACFRQYLGVLFLMPSVKAKHGKAIAEIKAMKIHYTKPEESRIFASLEQSPEEMQELTERERQVAELASKGMRNREIARQLYISEETVKSHIRSIFHKTNIDRRSRIIEILK